MSDEAIRHTTTLLIFTSCNWFETVKLGMGSTITEMLYKKKEKYELTKTIIGSSNNGM